MYKDPRFHLFLNLRPISTLETRTGWDRLFWEPGPCLTSPRLRGTSGQWPHIVVCTNGCCSLLQMVHRKTVKKRCRCGWIDRGMMWWVSTPFHTSPGVSVAWRHCCPVMLRALLYNFPLSTANELIKTRWHHLCCSRARWLGGAAVPVHPGLQGDVQAFTGGAAEERVGCVRGAHPCGGQRCCATASEGSHVWIQSPPLLQRIPGNRQRCQNWQDAGGRWGCMNVCDCVRVRFSPCMCACMFSCLHNVICTAFMCESIQQLFTAGSESRIMLCLNVVYSSMLGCMFGSLKVPMEACTTPQSKCYTNFSKGVVMAGSWGLVETQMQILNCSEQLKEIVTAEWSVVIFFSWILLCSHFCW